MVFKDDACYFFMCVCLLANEALHPVFTYVCHRSVTIFTIRHLCFLIEVGRVLFLEKSHDLRTMSSVSHVTHGGT